jgi:hypothetical protein
MDEYDDAMEGGREISETALVFGEIGTSCLDSVSLASPELSPSTMMAIGEGGIAARELNGVGRLLLAFGVDRSKDGRNAVLGGGKEALFPKEVFQTGADGGGGAWVLDLAVRDVGRGRAVLGVNDEREEEGIREGMTIVVRPWPGASSGELLVDEEVEVEEAGLSVCSFSSLTFAGS